MNLINPTDLGFNLHSRSSILIEELKIRLEVLNAMPIQSKSSLSEELPIGSRVRLTDGKLGRVWSKNKAGAYYINRDGYAQDIKIRGSELENLSEDEQGIIEREVWLIEKKIAELVSIDKNSEFPNILKSNRITVVQVVAVDKDYPCEIFTFVDAVNLQSHQIKLPGESLLLYRYYEITTVDNQIVKILASSEYVFKTIRNESLERSNKLP